MSKPENTLTTTLIYKYLPFWPLFAILLAASIIGTWVYLRYYSIPQYEVSASILIKDEKKGVNESKMTESIDAFTSSKIVENEINVLHSRTLMKQVVDKLMLYAPTYEEGKYVSTSAYMTSPIRIKLKNPEEAQEIEKVYFSYDASKNKVKIGDEKYSLNKWIDTPYGVMKFLTNDAVTTPATNPLYFSIIKPSKVSNYLLDKVYIQPSSKVSTVLDLVIEDEVPKRGEDILNQLISSYNEVELTDRTGLASSTLSFVENRIKLVKKELEDLENALVEYKSTKGGANLSDQSRLFLENVGNNDRKISEINAQIAILDNVENFVRTNTKGIAPSTLGVNDPVLSQLLGKLYEAEIDYEKLKNTTAENNPILVSLNEEIKNIRPRVLENIRTQRVNLYTSKTNLIAANQQYNAALQVIPQKERELLDISRQQAIKNTAYNFLLQKREEAILSYAPTIGDSRVIDKAESSTHPVKPKPLQLYLIATIGALVLGFSIVRGKELLNSKLLFRSEIEEYTTVPIVAELSIMKHQKGSVFNEPTEASVVEQFRKLRVTMGLYGRTYKKKIMVTSSIPGEGKSFVSSNLAYSLASSGKKVVLLDFDLRNPNTSVLFDMYKQEGITEYLLGDITPEAVIKDTPYPNLYVAPAGTNIGDHTDLMLQNNNNIKTLFSYLETAYDYIIIDTPPIDLVSDSYILSKYSDLTLLVMRHAHTPKNLVQNLANNDALKMLNKVGIVFNGIKPRGFGAGRYSYGYGYGYGNVSKYEDKTYQRRSIKTKA